VLRHHHPNTANKVDVIYALSQVRSRNVICACKQRQQDKICTQQQQKRRQKQKQHVPPRVCNSMLMGRRSANWFAGQGLLDNWPCSSLSMASVSRG
jgi:hypothetical protein